MKCNPTGAQFESRCGIPDVPEITEKNYKACDSIVEFVATHLCFIFEINPIARKSFCDHVADSLNQEKGHPARIIFLTMIFHTLDNLEEEAAREQHIH